MKDVDYYINLPYNYIIEPINDENDFYYYAKVLELDGCQSTGDTLEEVYKNIKDAMNGWIKTKIEGKYEVPLPLKYDNFSGEMIIRIPKSLHYRLTVEAKKEGISLNKYILYKLNKYM